MNMSTNRECRGSHHRVARVIHATHPALDRQVGGQAVVTRQVHVLLDKPVPAQSVAEFMMMLYTGTKLGYEHTSHETFWGVVYLMDHWRVSSRTLVEGLRFPSGLTKDAAQDVYEHREVLRRVVTRAGCRREPWTKRRATRNFECNSLNKTM